MTGPFEATFTETAEALDDEVHVTIPYFDDTGESQFGPVDWRPDPTGALPTVGDRALVVEADTGIWWVIQFVPAPV